MPPLLCPFFTCDQMASLMSPLVWNMVTLSVYFHVGLFFFAYFEISGKFSYLGVALKLI